MIAATDTIHSSETRFARPSTGRATDNLRFTLDGSDEMENHLGQTCSQVLDGVRRIIPERKLEALLLGGGYGRGEGGVLRTEAGDRTYNDLEFYVFVRGNRLLNRRRYHGALHSLAEQLSPAARVEVEFKILSLARLRRAPASMFYYDLMLGHRRLWGEGSLLAGCERHRDAGGIPHAEATRLLMNRCSGLLFARGRLESAEVSPEDRDFIGRNLAKSQLAFGDAVLTAQGQYHWSCRERHRRLKQQSASEELPWLAEVQRHHRAGLEFKLHPQRTITSNSTLLNRLKELSWLGLRLWLWLESRRLSHPFASARDYALSPINKCPETNGWRNGLLNLDTFGLRALRDSRFFRYPRERIFHALVLLLWERESLDEAELFQQIQRELGVRTSGVTEALDAYAALWRRFN